MRKFDRGGSEKCFRAVGNAELIYSKSYTVSKEIDWEKLFQKNKVFHSYFVENFLNFTKISNISLLIFDLENSKKFWKSFKNTGKF